MDCLLLRISLLSLGLLTVLGCRGQVREAPAVATASAAAWRPERLEVQHLPNAYRLHAQVTSGGMPEGDEAFAELAALGFRTIISVDGAKPDVALAEAHGLRYVHLPHGYDGIPDDCAMRLAKAIRDLPGPVYIHCHHGHHRSPAAATVACVSVGWLQPDAALQILQTAGTSENYRGLFESAQAARRIDDRRLDRVPNDFPATAKLPPMAEAMVEIEHRFHNLKLIAKSEWRVPAEHPALVPRHEALLLREYFVELLRSEAVVDKPAAFQEMLRDSQQAAEQLEDALASESRTSETDRAAQTALDLVDRQCVACHRAYRDVPLREKHK